MKDAVKQLKHILEDDLSMGNASPRIDYNRLQYQLYIIVSFRHITKL